MNYSCEVGFKWPSLMLFVIFVFGKSAGFIPWPWWSGLFLLLFVIPYKRRIKNEEKA
jgi:protein-S-isoprenylcysteine O-methyltransferase Ste14